MRLTCSTDIKCTPEAVWYWLGDPERAKEWQTNVGQIRIIERKSGWTGTTFIEEVLDESGSTEMRGVVTDYRENRALGMHLEGKYNGADLAWRLEPAGEYTRLTADADVRFKSMLMVISFLLRGAFKRRILAEMELEFDRLKALCEGKA